MQVRLGVAKVPKYGVLESGDTFEVVERRRGGFSVIMADGQGSGAAAKRLSNLVVSRAMSLISEGARDGAVARAVNDVLYALRDGKVSCELAILSVDLRTRTLVISRNTAVPVWVRTAEGLIVCSEACSPIGMQDGVKPCITEFPLSEGMLAATFTDGVLYSGVKHGLGEAFQEAGDLIGGWAPDRVERLSEALLELGMRRDNSRPQDDMAAVALGVVRDESEHKVRKMTVSFPM